MDEYMDAKKYWSLHSKCPKCKSDMVETTLLFLFESRNENGVYEVKKDRNCASCLCGWKGIVHDMVE